MFISKLIAPALFASGAFAQYVYGSSSSSAGAAAAAAVATTTDALVVVPTAPAGQVAVQVVKVSDKNGDLRFIPDNIQAPVGSMIQFQYYPKNHSVVQAGFAAPCVPLEQSNATAGPGFFSGFMPVDAGSQTKPTFTIMVNTQAPIWFYCSQAKHCQGGMVGVINAVAGSPKNIDTFRAAAAAAPANLSPGQSGSGSSSGSGTSAVASGGVTTTLATATSSSTASGTALVQATTAGGPAAIKLGAHSGIGLVLAAFGAVMFA